MSQKSKEYSIRQAGSSDSAGIARVHVQSWREIYRNIVPAPYLAAIDEQQRAEFWRGLLVKNPEGVFVAIDGASQIIGFVSVGPLRDIDPKYRGELFAIYLLERFHGRGIGRALFTHAQNWLISRRLAPYLLWVFEKNPTRAFYEHMGGVLLAARKEEEIGGVSLAEVAYGFGE